MCSSGKIYKLFLMMNSNTKLIRIGLFLLVAIGAGLAFYYDLPSYLTLENMESIKERLGLWAPVVFMLAFVIGELLQVPSVLWIVFAGLIWPAWMALPIALVSAMLAATCAFIVARYFLGAKFHEKLPKNIQNLNEKISESPLKAVIGIRLTTFLHPLVHWALAASSVKLPAFLFGTFLGILPATVALVFLGEQFLHWWDQYSGFILGLAVVLVAIYLIRARRKARR